MDPLMLGHPSAAQQGTSIHEARVGRSISAALGSALLLAAAMIVAATCATGCEDSADSGSAGGLATTESTESSDGLGAYAPNTESSDESAESATTESIEPTEGFDGGAAADASSGGGEEDTIAAMDAAEPEEDTALPNDPGEPRGRVWVYERRGSALEATIGGVQSHVGPRPALSALTAEGTGCAGLSVDVDKDLEPELASPTWPWALRPSLDAGELTVEGLLLPVILSAEGAEASYDPQFSTVGELFDDDSKELRVRSSGSDPLGKFDVLVGAPADLILLEPELGPSQSLNLSTDLAVRWTPEQPGALIEVRIVGLGFGNAVLPGPVVMCNASDADAELIIPAELIATVPGSFGTDTAIAVSRVFEVDAPAGDHTVRVRTESTVIGWAKSDQ